MTRYKKGSHIILPKTGSIKTEEGLTIINPTADILLANGYEPYDPPTPAPHVPTYEELVEQYIAERYTIAQELAISRQRETKPAEWQAYFDYCEECKARARDDINPAE